MNLCMVNSVMVNMGAGSKKEKEEGLDYAVKHALLQGMNKH